jgi:hypothetical protein
MLDPEHLVRQYPTMRVSITDAWCDPRSGTCEVGRPADPTEYSKHFVEKLSAGCVHVARCDVEGQVVFVVFDLDRAGLEASVRTMMIGSLQRHERSLVAVVREWDTARCTLTLVPPGTRADRVLVARAAAVVQASWGWDESQVIHVRVEDEAIDVAPRHGAEGWSADAQVKR